MIQPKPQPTEQFTLKFNEKTKEWDLIPTPEEKDENRLRTKR